MKKRMFALLVCIIGFLVYWLLYNGKQPVEDVIENMNLDNYTRETSFSISFEKGKDVPGISHINNSLLVYKTKKNGEAKSNEYELSINGEHFAGKEVHNNRLIQVKSPMYEKNVLFNQKIPANKMEKYEDLNKRFLSFIDETKPNVKMRKNVSGLESDIRTMEIKKQGENLKDFLFYVSGEIANDSSIQSIYEHNEEIRKALLKKKDAEKKLIIKGLNSYQEKFKDVIHQSVIKDASIEIKIDKYGIAKELNAIIPMEYTDERGEDIAFKLYISVNTWAVGKTKIQSLESVSSNAIPIDELSMEEFDANSNFNDDNLIEDGRKGTFNDTNERIYVKEDVFNLEELGDDFIPLKKKEEKRK